MTTSSDAMSDRGLYPSDLLHPSDGLVPHDSLLAVLEQIIATAEETKVLAEPDVDALLDEIIRLANESVDLAGGAG